MMVRTAFPFLATGWAVLWALLSLSDGGFYLDGPQGLAVPIIIVFSGWLLAWLRSDAWTMFVLQQQGRWTLSAVGMIPLAVVGLLPFIDHGRHGGSAELNIVTSSLKLALFSFPWFLLLWAGKHLGDREANQTEEVPAAVPPPAPLRQSTDTLFISIGDTLRPVSWRQIVWLEADGNYVRIFTQETDYFYRRSLSDLLRDLGDDRFARIHRSRAVNIAEIAAIQPLAKGDAELHLRDGKRLRMSRRFRRDLAERMGRRPAYP